MSFYSIIADQYKIDGYKYPPNKADPCGSCYSPCPPPCKPKCPPLVCFPLPCEEKKKCCSEEKKKCCCEEKKKCSCKKFECCEVKKIECCEVKKDCCCKENKCGKIKLLCKNECNPCKPKCIEVCCEPKRCEPEKCYVPVAVPIAVPVDPCANPWIKYWPWNGR